MESGRLTSSEKRMIAAIIVAAAVCILYIKANYFAAFPEASIDLRYSKEEITRRAAGFLHQQGLSETGYRNLTLFDPDETASVYLEREVGLEEANRLMRTKVSVWRWRARWFRPPEKEELIAYLSPSGEVVGYEHVIAEAAPGARLSKDAARRLAEDFLRQRTGKPQRLVEEQLQERPNRYDYLFTWEEEGFRVKDAMYRRTVTVQGDRVGQYAEYLHVPEQWKRDFANLRSKNELYATIAQALWVLLGLAAVGVLIQSFRRGLVRWRPLLAIAVTVGGLMVLNEWNSLPFFIDSRPTSSPYLQTVLFGLLMGLGAGVGIFFYVIVAAAAGEPLYRASQPGKLSLLAVPGGRAVRTKEFFLATVVGYGLAAVHIAFVVAFYLIGRRFGVWSPQDVNYSDFLSTKVPWIYPLTVSLLAATSEEFWFRLLAVPLLKKYLRSTWPAVIIPAFLWGFLHANYPQQPAYIRGVEVGIIGVVAGLVMLRFGILATLVWHYTVDAVLIGMFLIRAQSWSFQLSGWLVGLAVIFPLAAALASYWKHGGFLTEASLLNAAVAPEVSSPPAERPEACVGVEPLAPRWPVRWLYAAAIIVGAAGLALGPTVFGDFIRVRVSRQEAAAIAAREFAKRVPNPGEWRQVTEFWTNLNVEDLEYLRRIAGAAQANDVVRDRTQAGIWAIRFLIPLREEQWRILVDQQGRPFNVSHHLNEKAPGGSPSAEEAQRIAEDYLTRVQALPISRYHLVDTTTDKKEKRTDYTFVWEDPSFHVGEAKARVSLDVMGGDPSRFQRFLKLPDQWLREFQRPRLAGVLIPGAIGAFGILLLVAFVKRLSGRGGEAGSGHRYHWRAYLAVALTGCGLAVLATLNRWPLVLSNYDTAAPLQSHVTELLLGRLIVTAVFGCGLFLAALAADLFLQLATGDRKIRGASAVRAVAVFTLMWGASRILGGAQAHIPGPRLSLPLWGVTGIDMFSPALAILSAAVVFALTLVCLGTITAASAVKYLSPRRRFVLIGVVGLFYAAGHASAGPEFLFSFCATILVAAAGVVLVGICAADLVTFGTAAFWFAVAGPAATLIEQPAAALRWNGAAAAVVAVMIGATVLARFKEGEASGN